MSLIQLIYASTAAESLTTQDLRKILSVAREHNKSIGVTGFLCANKHYFLQCLEGERATVEALYKQIEKDKRHSATTILRDMPIEQRTFAFWSMGGVLEIDSHHAILEKFNPEKAFQPYKLSDDESLNLLIAFSAFRAMTQHNT